MLPHLTKLAASQLYPLKSNPQYLNDLLQRKDQSWPQDVLYLRDTYEDIVNVWNENTEDDEALYKKTAPKLEELITGLKDVSHQRSGRRDLFRAVELAGYDYQTSLLYSDIKDYTIAVIYQSYAIDIVFNLLESLTREGKGIKASFLIKGYGYDIGADSDQGGNQTHLYDTAQPSDGHTTPKPAANTAVDVDAEKQFPELAQKKHEKVHFPPRLD